MQILEYDDFMSSNVGMGLFTSPTINLYEMDFIFKCPEKASLKSKSILVQKFKRSNDSDFFQKTFLSSIINLNSVKSTQ